MKKILPILALVLAPMIASGCADEGDIEECIGLNCPNGFQWPYGGEMRIWYIKLPDGSELQRFIGFFIESQEPDILPDQPIGYCGRDLSETPGIGFGITADYIDVGEKVTVDLGQRMLDIPRYTAEEMGGPVVDWAGREHDIAYLREDSVPTEDSYFNAFHPIYTDEGGELTEGLEAGIYMPPRVEVLEPIGTPVITLHSGRDQVVRWKNLEEPTGGQATGGAIVFIPDAGEPFQCIVANSEEMVVPGEIIDAFGADTGIMVIGSAANSAVLRPDGRWQSMFGMNCHLSPFQRVP